MTHLSIIMCFLDAAPFIAEAIESVMAQSYRHWELILVDDGSRDGSSLIAAAFARRYADRIRYIEHPQHANRGISASRNVGLAESRGALIAFLDADDVYLPQRLEKHVDLLDRMPEIDMVQSNTLRWFTWGENGLEDIEGQMPYAESGIVHAPELLRQSLRYDPESGWFPCTCSVTLRRSAAEEVGGFENGFLTLCEDWVFWQKLYLRKNVYVLPETLAKYRKHPTSVLHRAAEDHQSFLGQRYEMHVAYLRWLKSYLEANGASQALIALVRRKLWPEDSVFLRHRIGLPPALMLTIRTAGQRFVQRIRMALRGMVSEAKTVLEPNPEAPPHTETRP